MDYSFDKSKEKKSPTTKNFDYAPIVSEPKRVTAINFSFANLDMPKKSQTFDDTSGTENKKPTTIDTRQADIQQLSILFKNFNMTLTLRRKIE